MKKILLFFIPLFSLTSCFYEKMYHLSEEDKSWMNVYTQGDTILFTSEAGVDTISITKKIIHDDVWPFRPNEGCGPIFYANASCSFTIKHNGVETDGLFLITKERADSLTVSLQIGNRKYGPLDGQKVIFSHTTIGDKSFNDVVIVDTINSILYQRRENTPTSFLWSKSMGILQYKYNGGDVYTFMDTK